MDRTRIRAIGDVAFCGVLIGISALALFDLQGLRQSRFDYLSSAAVPRVLAWLVIVLAFLVAVRAIVRLIATTPAGRSGPKGVATSATAECAGTQIWHVIVIAAATLAYILAIIWAVIPYSVSTTIFLVFAIILLSPSHKRNWLLILPVATFIGGAGEYVFVHLLSLPFPRW